MWPSLLVNKRTEQGANANPIAADAPEEDLMTADPAAVSGEGADEQSPINAAIPDDDIAVENFVRKHMPSMIAIAESLLGDQAAAEDCVQEAFFKLSRTAGIADEFPSLECWLHHTVISQALMRLRIMHENEAHNIAERLQGLAADMDPASTPWRQLSAPVRTPASTDCCALAVNQINQLPAIDRRLLQLHDVHEWSKGDVAEALHLTQSEVCARLPQARARLMQLLKPVLDGHQ